MKYQSFLNTIRKIPSFISFLRIYHFFTTFRLYKKNYKNCQIWMDKKYRKYAKFGQTMYEIWIKNEIY